MSDKPSDEAMEAAKKVNATCSQCWRYTIKNDPVICSDCEERMPRIALALDAFAAKRVKAGIERALRIALRDRPDMMGDTEIEHYIARVKEEVGR